MIEHSYIDAFGNEHDVPEATIDALRSAIGPPADAGPLVMRAGESRQVDAAEIVLENGTTVEVRGELPTDLPLGYHRLIDDNDDRSLIVSPGRCHVPPNRTWGWSVQLYSVRSELSWGIGDMGDLRRLAEWAVDRGAGLVLVNPMGAVAPVTPRQPSPYFPASRRFLDPIYLRVEDVEGAGAVDLDRAANAGRALNRGEIVDRDDVWRIKAEALERIWEKSPPGGGFEAWCDERGGALTEFAVWCVLAERHGPDWRQWPAAVSRPDRPEVKRVAQEDRQRVRFHQWLQWLCRKQFQAAAEGLLFMNDLPIGFDPGGADAWTWQDQIATGVTIGAPPDEFNTRGQDWGIPPFTPHRLREADYAPFIQTIRSNLVQGGGLRIDHVMGLFRQFWIPAGADPAEGAYVRFPSSDLLDIVCLESVRSRATVVGEDLGTVEPGVREELAERRMLSYRLLWFEHEEPQAWPEHSMASVTTHDLPTVAGMWTGSDLEEQQALGMAPNVESTQRIRQRIAQMTGLGTDADLRDVTAAVHRLLARAGSRLVCAALDDVALAERRPNLPGADHVRPNWSIPLPVDLETIVSGSHSRRIAEILASGGDDAET
ncbi:MAG TPA: 4-alpha-glucanotransferase [Acidimicrobiia bacterium]|nr:4-alpha-glucanotransferase [Acidimicrobiia bacterium]